MTAPAPVAGLGVNVSRPGAVHPPAPAAKVGEREATSSTAKTPPAPNPTPLAGTHVRVTGGPYLLEHDRVGRVLPWPGPWLRVLVRDRHTGEARFLDLHPTEVSPA